MTETILFIHGTGVRSAAFAKSLALVSAQVAKYLPRYRVAGCDWGDAFGSRLNLKGASIPGYTDTGRAADAIESSALARWTLLADDPLLEVRISSFKVPLGGSRGPILWGRLLGLGAASTPLELLASWHLGGLWPDFIERLCADPSWRRAAERTPGVEAELAPLFARAVTAALLIDLRERGESGLTGTQRDLLAASLVTPLGGTGMGIGDWMLGKLTDFAVPRRNAAADGSGPVIGDILRYQARGETLQNFIGERVRETGATILLAHSLGGVAAVDWLATAARGMRALVTAGSQAPYFYEIDALRSCAFKAGLPDFFPRKWINFVDRRDFLGYQARPVFPDHAIDVVVDNGQAFPASHSAYWQNDSEVWPEIARFLP